MPLPWKPPLSTHPSPHSAFQSWGKCDLVWTHLYRHFCMCYLLFEGQTKRSACKRCLFFPSFQYVLNEVSPLDRSTWGGCYSDSGFLSPSGVAGNSVKTVEYNHTLVQKLVWIQKLDYAKTTTIQYVHRKVLSPERLEVLSEVGLTTYRLQMLFSRSGYLLC